MSSHHERDGARRLVLWDVDGTLLHSGGHGGRAFLVAIERVLGRPLGQPHGVLMAGKTDPQIALEVLAAAEIAEEEARNHLPGVLNELEAALAEVAPRINQDGWLFPGVAEVVRRLHDDERVVQTLLTGNLAANAVVKVAAFGIEDCFDLEIGAYGSDSHDRDELVPLALSRAREKYGDPFDPAHVWVVGDTQRDLACARAGGARCLLVATGIVDYDELSTLGADELLRDLSEVDRVVELLSS